MTSREEILNLLYEYCWLVDQGRYKEIGELFADADIYFRDYLAYSHDKEGFAGMFEGSNIAYEPDNTPRTIHMCIDPVIVVDEEAGTAKAKHYTVVVQGIDGTLPPQVIVMDQKFDTFKRGEDGKWRYATRNMANRCWGEMSYHQKDPSILAHDLASSTFLKEIQELNINYEM